MSKEYYLKNRDILLQKKREYYELNKEKFKEYGKKRWEKIKSDDKKLKEYNKYSLEYYYKKSKNNIKYKEREIKRNKMKWIDPIKRKKNEEIKKIWRSTPIGIYSSLKYRKKDGFNLSRNEFIDWYNNQEKICTYCKLSIEQIRNLPYPYNRKNGLVRLSIDRKDSNIGYTLDNITLCCFLCNVVKNNLLTYEEMLKVGEIILIPKFNNLIN